ncbi:hypothetical protein NDU88_006667 [Pleurodeles waltl]|uniref:Uncharacterized protein n=1 Tax=Pleurodeles waltl TaxID=8319 RepID=A0AAV7QJQ3_PLEWA|nr:hypothetical protein NDU88_006667 [Pleurodeles waltl]
MHVFFSSEPHYSDAHSVLRIADCALDFSFLFASETVCSHFVILFFVLFWRVSPYFILSQSPYSGHVCVCVYLVWPRVCCYLKSRPDLPRSDPGRHCRRCPPGSLLLTGFRSGTASRAALQERQHQCRASAAALSCLVQASERAFPAQQQRGPAAFGSAASASRAPCPGTHGAHTFGERGVCQQAHACEHESLLSNPGLIANVRMLPRPSPIMTTHLQGAQGNCRVSIPLFIYHIGLAPVLLPPEGNKV